MQLVLETTMYVSYNQFTVFDASLSEPFLDWSDAHFNQGFARLSSTVSFRTLVPHGWSALRVYTATHWTGAGFERVIAVPFEVLTGKVEITGPEERVDRHVDLRPGHYRLVAAQRRPHEESEQVRTIRLEVELAFEAVPMPIGRSELVVADAELDPPDPLVEDAQPA